jgi:hypothetical protein
MAEGDLIGLLTGYRVDFGEKQQGMPSVLTTHSGGCHFWALNIIAGDCEWPLGKP